MFISVSKKCYQSAWNKKLYDLCVKVKKVKKCRRITKGTDVTADCFTVVTRLAEEYKNVKVGRK